MSPTAGEADVIRPTPSTVPEPEQQSAATAEDLAEREITELEPLSAHGAGAAEDADVRRHNSALRTRAGKKWTQRLDCSIKVRPAAARDHLANERTFLGWLRTATALALLGLIIAQLFRLQGTATPDPVLGFHRIGTPLAGSFIAMALVTVLLGASRFFRQQYALNQGRCHGASWEIFTMGGLVTLSLLAVLVLVIAVDIRKEDIWLPRALQLSAARQRAFYVPNSARLHRPDDSPRWPTGVAHTIHCASSKRGLQGSQFC